MAMASETKIWTLDELHSLPDDGNKYELIRGELFVTPAPTNRHETILARLTRILDPHVTANDLGMIYHPRAVVQIDGSEVEPDLMVRQPHPDPDGSWADAPLPTLVVEVSSRTTRRRDREHKRAFYLDIGIPEYWIVDPVAEDVRVVRAGAADVVATTHLTWAPAGAAAPLVLDVPALFR